MKSLHNEEDLEEIRRRLERLTEFSKPKWGRMNAAQMLKHCSLVLQIPLSKLKLPETGFLIRSIGVVTKNEMKIFGNGIPPNMPTYSILKCEEQVSFEECRINLNRDLDQYYSCFLEGNLPDEHELFGKMKVSDWGFLEHKHLHHHLKQFGI